MLRLVVGHELETAEVRVVRPADERVPGLAGERGGTEADYREPLAVTSEREVAHGLADQVVTEQVVLVERLVETNPLAREDRAHRYGTEFGVPHPTTTVGIGRGAPVPSGLPRSRASSYDFVPRYEQH
jgi:hypothetical protein